jgi:hypothetical protein
MTGLSLNNTGTVGNANGSTSICGGVMVVNNSGVISGSPLQVCGASFTNSGNVTGGNVNISVTGNVTNSGNISGNSSVTVTGGNITNTAPGNISGTGNTSLNATPNGTIVNNGTIGATGNTTVTAQNITNNSPGVIGNTNGTTTVTGNRSGNGTYAGSPVSYNGNSSAVVTVVTPPTPENMATLSDLILAALRQAGVTNPQGSSASALLASFTVLNVTQTNAGQPLLLTNAGKPETQNANVQSTPYAVGVVVNGKFMPINVTGLPLAICEQGGSRLPPWLSTDTSGCGRPTN